MSNNSATGWTRSALEAVHADLSRRGLSYNDGPEGGTYVLFEPDNGQRFVIACVPTTAPARGLLISAAAAEPVPREKWSVTLLACNHWNANTPAAKIHLQADEWATDDHATLVVQSWLPVPDTEPPSADQIRSALDAVLTACVLLWLPDLVAPVAGGDTPAT